MRAKNFKHYVWSLTQENQETGLIGMEEEYHVCVCIVANKTF